MFAHSIKKMPKESEVILQAIAAITNTLETLNSYQDIWKPNEQTVVHPIYKYDLPITYGAMRQSICTYHEALGILQRMYNNEPISKDHQYFLARISVLQNIPEIMNYSNVKNNGPKL
jgi:hypothetical protein